MIRTHEAGTLRASHAGERVVLAGGWRGAGTTAAWCSLTCGTRAA